MTTRRDFLKVSLLAGSALAIGFNFDDDLDAAPDGRAIRVVYVDRPTAGNDLYAVCGMRDCRDGGGRTRD